MNKKISSSVALVFLIVLAVLVGGLMLWQSFGISEEKELTMEEKQSEEVMSEEKETAPKEETSGWKTYTNEEYGFEFEYPINWGEITFESQKTSEVHAFSSENEKIIKFWYHESSGILAFITQGEERAVLTSRNGDFDNYQDILKIIYPDKKIKTIYTVSPDALQFYANIGREIKFSFDGDYICFIESVWESSKSFLVNIATEKNILENYSIWFFDVYKDVYWSSDDKVLAIRSRLNLMDGQGTDGIFVSDHEKPEKLNKVFEMTMEETYGGSYFYDLYFIDNDNFSFSIFSRKNDSEEFEDYKEERRIYKYNVKTKELKEIN